jgi:hypothetical protein
MWVDQSRRNPVSELDKTIHPISLDTTPLFLHVSISIFLPIH